MKKLSAICIIALAVQLLATTVAGCASELPPFPPPAPAPTPSPPPAPTPSPPPEDIAKIVSEELEELSIGTMVYNPPDKMTVGVRERVEARISREEFTEGLAQGLKGRGVPQVEEIKVGTLMKVRLMGDRFDIKPLSHEEQVVARSEFTQWEWDVVPLKAGRQVLSLSVTVKIPVPGYGEKQRDYPVLERDIDVSVNRMDSIMNFLGDNWKWLITTIIAATGVVMAIVTIISKRRKRGGDGQGNT